jgi:hypothetical protein
VLTVTFNSTDAFKLAAYGVKQGGIGAVMAGGFPMLKKTGKRPESVTEQSSPVCILAVPNLFFGLITNPLQATN